MSQQPGEMTQAEYARHRGVVRSAIHALMERGRIPFRVDDDGTRYIDPAAADVALNEARERIGSDDDEDEPSPPASGPPTLTKARTATEIYRAKIADLQYRKQLGELVPVVQVQEAAQTCGDTLAALIKQLSTRAEELHGAGVANGVQGVRAVLKAIERELAEKVAVAFRALAAEAAAGEASDEETYGSEAAE